MSTHKTTSVFIGSLIRTIEFYLQSRRVVLSPRSSILAKSFFITGLKFTFGGVFSNKPIQVKLKSSRGTLNVKLRENKSDLSIFQDIFFRHDYALDFNKINKNKIHSILDCGANIGLATIYFKQEFPKAAIECIEIDSKSIELLNDNLVANKCSAQVHCFALGEKCGLREIFMHPHRPSDHSFYISGKTKKIVTKNLDSLHKTFDLIKVDIEGAEYDLIRGGSKTLLNTQCIVGEIHPALIGIEKTRKVIDFLETNFDVEYKKHYRWTIFKAYKKK